MALRGAGADVGIADTAMLFDGVLRTGKQAGTVHEIGATVLTTVRVTGTLASVVSAAEAVIGNAKMNASASNSAAAF